MRPERASSTAYFRGPCDRVGEDVARLQALPHRCSWQRKSLYYLPKFRWYEERRPLNKDDIYPKDED